MHVAILLFMPQGQHVQNSLKWEIASVGLSSITAPFDKAALSDAVGVARRVPLQIGSEIPEGACPKSP